MTSDGSASRRDLNTGASQASGAVPSQTLSFEGGDARKGHKDDDAETHGGAVNSVGEGDKAAAAKSGGGDVLSDDPKEKERLRREEQKQKAMEADRKRRERRQAVAESEQAMVNGMLSAEPFKVELLVKLSETEDGEVTIRIEPAWAPRGAARVRELVNAGYYDNCAFFRVLPNFMCQFGLSGDPAENLKWKSKKILDDAVVQSNKRGFVTFAMAGVNTRTTQLFINFKDNARLDDMDFAPIGQVVDGMDVIDRVYAGYKQEPDQGMIMQHGAEYLETNFPKLSYIKTARIAAQAA